MKRYTTPTLPELNASAEILAEQLVHGFVDLVVDALDGAYVGSPTYRELELATYLDAPWRYVDVFEAAINAHLYNVHEDAIVDIRLDEDQFRIMCYAFIKEIEKTGSLKFLMHTAGACALSIINTGHDCTFFKLDDELAKFNAEFDKMFKK